MTKDSYEIRRIIIDTLAEIRMKISLDLEINPSAGRNHDKKA